MSKVFFISDLHLGHKNIINFSKEWRYGETIEEHDRWIVTQWNSVVSKNDVTYVLGDIAFNDDRLPLLDEMNGRKVLVLGNHDIFKMEDYKKYFYKIKWFGTYKGFWISHCPIHPAELRGKKNIHGHVHHNSIDDDRYINVCVEPLGGTPIEFTKIAEEHGQHKI